MKGVKVLEEGGGRKKDGGSWFLGREGRREEGKGDRKEGSEEERM